MSTLLDESVEMNMTYLLPFLCILYVLLPRKARSMPIKSFKVKDKLSNVNIIDNANDFSDVLAKAVTNGTGRTLVGDHIDDSSDHFPSSQGLRAKDKVLKMKIQESKVPGYMMDLYKRLSRNTLGLLNSNIVRSFRNIEIRGK